MRSSRVLKVVVAFVIVPLLVLAADGVLWFSGEETVSRAFWALRESDPRLTTGIACGLTTALLILIVHLYQRPEESLLKSFSRLVPAAYRAFRSWCLAHPSLVTGACTALGLYLTGRQAEAAAMFGGAVLGRLNNPFSAILKPAR